MVTKKITKKQIATDLALEIAKLDCEIQNLKYAKEEAETRVKFLEEHFHVVPETKFMRCPKHPKNPLFMGASGKNLSCLICVESDLAWLRKIVMLSAADPERFKIGFKPNIYLNELNPQPKPTTPPEYQLAVSELQKPAEEKKK